MDPWGRGVVLRDLLTGARAWRQIRFQEDLRLAKLVCAMLAGKPEEIRRMVPED